MPLGLHMSDAAMPMVLNTLWAEVLVLSLAMHPEIWSILKCQCALVTPKGWLHPKCKTFVHQVNAPLTVPGVGMCMGTSLIPASTFDTSFYISQYTTSTQQAES
jgi:hypothetical protein